MADEKIKNRCIIISGSPKADVDLIKKTVCKSDFVICADKGCLYAKEAGITPDIAVGDFDSYSDFDMPCSEIIRLDPVKDDTDTIHSIDTAFERGYKNIVLLSAIGGRLDHTYANIAALEYINSKGGRGEILSSNESVVYLTKGEYSYSNLKSKTFSLFPFGCEKVCVSYSGAKYPLDKYYLKSCYPMGISNIFTSDDAKIKIYDGNAILIINLSEI